MSNPTTTTSGPVGARRREWSRGLGFSWLFLALPAALFLAFFFLVPLAEMVVRSVTEPSADNYIEFFSTGAYLHVLANTFQTAAVTTICCVVLGYPYAYAMRKSGRLGFLVLSIALMLPFWASLLVRSFAWIILLQDTGVVNTVLIRLGVIHEPISLIRNQIGVTVGMTHILLPYMVLPLYTLMTRIDPTLGEAASTLGASPVRSFVRVFLPLSLPGMFAGSLLVFVLSLGFYVTPALLGGPANMLIGQLIAVQVSEQVAFGFASAIGVVLLVMTLAVLAISARMLRRTGALGTLPL